MQLGGGTVRPDVIRVGGIELDDKEKRVMLDGEPVTLTPTEYEILKLLIQNPGQVFSPREIYSKIWNDLPSNCAPASSEISRHIYFFSFALIFSWIGSTVLRAWIMVEP